MNKKISIITVVYNDVKGLLSTIKSVEFQKGINIEYLIVDGGSTDGTIANIESNQDVIDNWISESDNGIFDAMNKGIALANGDWLLFLNAGDLLMPNALNDLDLSDKYALIYGNTARADNTIDRPFELEIIKAGAMPACHQSMFYNKKLLGKELFYDMTYNLFGENELMMRLYKKGFHMKYINKTIAYFQGGGVSDSISNDVRKARYRYLYKYFGVAGIYRGICHKLGLSNYKKISE